MALVLDGATDCLRMAAVLGLSYPFTLCAWTKPPNNTQSAGALATGIEGSDINFTWMDHNAGSLRFICRHAGVDATATDAGITANVWQSIIGVAESATSKKAYHNGAAPGTDATNNGALPALDVFLIGARERAAGPEGFYEGRIAAVSVHNAAFSDANAAAHAAGTDPRTLPGCIHYFRLEDGKDDEVGAWVLANVGTPTYDAADNPTINYPSTGISQWPMGLPPGRAPGLRPYDSARLRGRRR